VKNTEAAIIFNTKWRKKKIAAQITEMTRK
jgi:hypothetical protein